MPKRYFKTGQKIFLRALTPEGCPAPDLISLTSYFHENGPGFIDVALPYQSREGEEYPFAAEAPFELISDAMGMGIRITGRVQGWKGRDLVRLSVEENLRVFQRRLQPRLDTEVGLRFTRGRGMLRTFFSQWEKNTSILQQGGSPSGTSNLPRARVNLSAGGIRFRLKAPVAVSDLCLILLELVPAEPAICILSEVIWAGEIEEDRQVTGMRFLNILEKDQKRIAEFLRRNTPPAPASPS